MKHKEEVNTEAGRSIMRMHSISHLNPEDSIREETKEWFDQSWVNGLMVPINKPYHLHLDVNNNVVVKELLSCRLRPMVKQPNKSPLVIFENKGE